MNRWRLALATACIAVAAVVVPQLASASSIDSWPGGLTFSAPVGSTSAVQTITVGERSENGFMPPPSVSSGPFQVVGGSCAFGFDVFLGPTCTIDVVFAPGATGQVAGNVHIDEFGSWSGGLFSRDIPLVGYGQPAPAPAVAALGSSYDFRAVRLGPNSPARTFTLQNKSSRPVYFSQPDFGALPFYLYWISGGTCVGQSVLLAYQGCTWSIYFSGYGVWPVGASWPTTMSVVTANAGTLSIALNGQQVDTQTGAGVSAGGYAVDPGMPDQEQFRHRVEVSIRDSALGHAVPTGKHVVYRWWSGGNQYVFRATDEFGFHPFSSPVSLAFATTGTVYQVFGATEVPIASDSPSFGFWGSSDPTTPNQFTICCGSTVPDFTGTIASPGGAVGVTGVYFVAP